MDVLVSCDLWKDIVDVEADPDKNERLEFGDHEYIELKVSESEYMYAWMCWFLVTFGRTLLMWKQILTRTKG